MSNLKPCPFCGRELIFFKEKMITKDGIETTFQYYMHDYSEKEEKCILDKIMMPFIIGAGDADPEKGIIGEYAEEWNKRASDDYDGFEECK